MIKKIVPTVLVIALLWPLGIGLIGKQFYKNTNYQGPYISITNQDYQQGYLTAQQTLKVTALGAFKTQLTEHQLPTQWIVKNHIRHGFLQIHSKLDIPFSKAIQQKIQTIWSDKHPLSLTSQVSLLGNSAFEASLAPFDYTNKTAHTKSGLMTIKGTIDHSGKMIADIDYPGFSTQLTNGKQPIFDIGPVTGQSSGRKVGQLWVGENTLQFANIHLHPSPEETDQATIANIVGLKLQSSAKLNQEKKDNQQINTQVAITADQFFLHGFPALSKVLFKVALQELDFDAVNQIEQQLAASNSPSSKTITQLLQKGLAFSAEMHAFDESGQQRAFGTDLQLTLLASDQPLKLETLLSNLNGHLQIDVAQSFIHDQLNLDRCVQQKVCSFSDGQYALNVTLKNGMTTVEANPSQPFPLQLFFSKMMRSLPTPNTTMP